MHSSLIEKLFSLNRLRGIHLNLGIPLQLDALLDHPSAKFQSVHIAGTNGKGSVSTMVAAGLQAQGYQTGLFTSPHLHSFKERFTINGKVLPTDWIEENLNNLMALCEQLNIPATFFELTTALAFKAFAEFGVEIACVEVGVGGRLDATNIIHPCLSIITSIGFDHCEFLGNTLEAIAHEKAGIIKPKVPVVIGPSVPLKSITPIAQQSESDLIQISGQFSTYLDENRAIARQAMEILKVSESAIEQGLKKLPRCRFEIHRREDLTIAHPLPELLVLDVAHNPAGVTELVRALKQQFPHKRWNLLCGFSKDKDISGCAELFRPVIDHVFPIASPSQRSASAQDVSTLFKQVGFLNEKIHLNSDNKASISEALKSCADSGNCLLVCGTFLIFTPLFQFLGLPCDPDALSLQEMRIA